MGSNSTALQQHAHVAPISQWNMRYHVQKVGQGFIQDFFAKGGKQLLAVENRGVRGSSLEIFLGNDYLRCNLEVLCFKPLV